MFIALDESLVLFFSLPSPLLLFFSFLLNFFPHIRVFGASFLNDDYKDRGGIRAVVLGAANRRVGRNRKEQADEGEPRDFRCNSGHKARLMRRSALW